MLFSFFALQVFVRELKLLSEHLYWTFVFVLFICVCCSLVGGKASALYTG